MIDKLRTDRNALFSAVICALLFILIIYAGYVHIQMYVPGTSLWVDEASLAENIVNRSVKGMLTPPLANEQSAPVFYLLFVKTLTLLFGTSESVLRLYSLIAWVLMLFAQGALLRKVFCLRWMYIAFALALSSIFLYYMRYSAELKPYMGDAAFVLVVLLGYHAYREGILKKGLNGAILLGLTLSVSMLFSSAATFAAASVVLVEFVASLTRKDRKMIICAIVCGAIFMSVFCANYFLWLKPADTEYMQIFWQENRLNLALLQPGVLRHDIHLFRELLRPLDHGILLTLPLAIAGFVISIIRKNIYTLTILVFFAILLAASAAGKYPIADRLWMFLYVIMFIYIFVFIDALRFEIGNGILAKALGRIIPVALSALLLLPNLTFPAYGRGEEWTFGVVGHMANPLIEYVRNNIAEGEKMYCFPYASVILKYKNGYETNKIGNVQNDNIIYGTTSSEYDIKTIASTNGSYVFFFMDEEYYEYLTEPLQERGILDLIMKKNDTYLYWFAQDISKVKASASCEIRDLKIERGGISGTAHIVNTGETVLSPEKAVGLREPNNNPVLDDYGKTYLLLRKIGDESVPKGALDGVVLGEINAPVLQGESVDITFEAKGIEPGQYAIDLVAKSEYAFSELGMPTVPVTIKQ